MLLTRLRVFNYRNFKEQEVHLCPGTSLFVGRNGQGKTNLLEAIYFLGYGKSFRAAPPRECIRHGEEECRIEGRVEQGQLSREIQVSISHSGKKLLVHGKEVAIDEFVGNLHMLAFTNAHLNVVRGGPHDRRAFLDRAMITLYPSHVRRLASYGRALKQRNRVLASMRDSREKGDEELLASWEGTLIQDGARIVLDRMRYVSKMKKELPSAIFGEEDIKLRYISTIGVEEVGEDELICSFRENLERKRTTDLRMGFTTVGPHRDDLKLYLNGKALAEFGSAGQQRGALLSLYFAQMEIHRNNHGFYPIFLVDDAEAELDEWNLRSFLSYLAERTQTFLTTAKVKMLPLKPSETRTFEVVAGTVRDPRAAQELVQ